MSTRGSGMRCCTTPSSGSATLGKPTLSITSAVRDATPADLLSQALHQSCPECPRTHLTPALRLQLLRQLAAAARSREGGEGGPGGGGGAPGGDTRACACEVREEGGVGGGLDPSPGLVDDVVGRGGAGEAVT